MFTNIFNTVAQKLSGLNPIKTFIKYALDKFLNELINNEIKLQDFKNGCLNLTGIGFNVANVNLKHLISSPYIMHSGSIGNLRIQLPNLSEVVTKSIQIQVDQIFIELKPNKDFYKNFKDQMKQLHQNFVFDYQESLPEEQLSENNPMDFFKQTLKKILLNIRIKVQNITVKICMNDPQVQRQHFLHYLIIKIPLINLHKNNNLKKRNLNVEQIKLDIQIPQISVHIEKTETTPKKRKQKHQDENEKLFKNSPFYSINDPSTILLIGLPKYEKLSIQTDKSIPRITISVLTNSKEQRRDIKVSVMGTRFEMILDPIQLKVLDGFVRQVREFRDIFQHVKRQLNLGQCGNQQIPSNRRAASSSRLYQSRSEDIFSSICMSILQPQPSLRTKKPSSLLDSMIKQTPNLEKSVSQFNEEFKKQLKQKNVLEKMSQEMSSQLRVLNFQKHIEMSFEVKFFTVYLLKKIEQQKYERFWVQNEGNETNRLGLNLSIGCSYFMLKGENMCLSVKEDGKLIQAELSSLRLDDVKLRSKRFQRGETRLSTSNISDEFIDVQSSGEFYRHEQGKINEEKSCKKFILREGDHYCATQILKINPKPFQTLKQKEFCFYNFTPKSSDNRNQSESVVYKPSLILSINKQKNFIKLQILQLALNFNLQIPKQILNILKDIYENQNMQNQPLIWHTQMKDNPSQKDNSKWKKKTMLQSKYNFGTDSLIYQNTIHQKAKPSMQFKMHQMSLAFYESPKQQCFCNCSKKGLYMEIFSPKIQVKNDVLILSVRKLISGSIQVENSHVSKMKAFLNISSMKGKQSLPLNLIIEKDHQNQINKILLIAPQCSLKFDQKDILQSIKLVSQQMESLHQIFISTKDLIHIIQAQELKSSLSHLKQKKHKSNSIQYETELQFYIPILQIHILDIQVLVKEIYVRKSPQNLVFKFSTLVVALSQKLQLFLNEMKNQELCLRELIQKKQKYHGFCKDSSIILQITDLNNENKIPESSNNKNSDNNMRKQQKFEYKLRQAYFQRIASLKSSLTITVSKSSTCQRLLTNTQKSKEAVLNSKEKFTFSKKPSHRQSESFCGSRSVILQEEQLKKVSITLAQPVYIMANVLCRLLERKEIIQQFLKQLSPLVQNIRQMPISSPTRKHSTDSQIDRLECLFISVSSGRVFVDIHPTFIQYNLNKSSSLSNFSNFRQNHKKQHKKVYNQDLSNPREIIFSSSRSFLQLVWEMTDIEIDKRVGSVKGRGSWGMKFSFLQHEDRQLSTNPVLIRQDSLGRLGFIPLLQISSLKLQLNSHSNFKNLTLTVNSLTFQSSLSTLCYLQLHFQHFFNHNIKHTLGLTLKQQEEAFQPLQLQNTSDDFIKLQQNTHQQNQELIQDLSQGLEYYRKKTQFKQQIKINFIQKPFLQPKHDPQTKIFLQELSIKSIKIKIYSGSDFEFISFDSMDQSREDKRNRINDSQVLKYLEVRIDTLSIVAKSNSLPKLHLDSMIKIQNLQINYSSKKQMKNGWLGQKKIQQVIFPVLKSLTNIKILIQTASNKLCVKLNKTPFDIGFTSEILQFVEQFKLVKSRIENSGWKKIYEKTKRIQKVQQGQEKVYDQQKEEIQQELPKFLLVFIPENRLNLRLVYKNISVLSDQSLISSSFLLNEEFDNHEKILSFINKWVKNLVLDNIGGLIGGTAINVLSDVIMQMLGFAYFLVSVIMGN